MDIIIGAGVTGLSYAKYTKNDYLILESDSEIGGYCRTIKKNGYIWDYSGHFFHFSDDNIREEVCSSMGNESLKLVEKKTGILYDNLYINFPFQKNIHELEKEEFIDCLYDLYFREEREEVTFKDFIYNRYGKSIAEKFLIPYNEKLYACDLNHLDKDAMGRFFPNASLDDIIKNFRKQDSSSYNSYFWYPYNGAFEYIRSISEGIENIRLKEKVVKIDVLNHIVQTENEEYKYENLVSTIPLPKLLEMSSMPFNNKVFTYNKVLVFNIGFDSKGLDNKSSWVYIPNKDIVFYRVGYYDNILAQDKMSLYVEIGFPHTIMGFDVQKLFNRVLCDLKKVGIVTTQKVVSYSVVLMDPAYVHINRDSISETIRVKEKLKKNDIYSIGRYGSWTYCSIEDNIKEAKKLANELMK